jgi:DMSO/TMAO reductase YedYZ molybdopterin-dependent catalytic subunit
MPWRYPSYARTNHGFTGRQRKSIMVRLSSLASRVLATGLMVLPVAAFAQQTAAPAAVQAAQPGKAPVTAVPAHTAEATAKQTVNTDVKAPPHAKLGDSTHTVPAKPAEPNKS